MFLIVSIVADLEKAACILVQADGDDRKTLVTYILGLKSPLVFSHT